MYDWTYAVQSPWRELVEQTRLKSAYSSSEGGGGGGGGGGVGAAACRAGRRAGATFRRGPGANLAGRASSTSSDAGGAGIRSAGVTGFASGTGSGSVSGSGGLGCTPGGRVAGPRAVEAGGWGTAGWAGAGSLGEGIGLATGMLRSGSLDLRMVMLSQLGQTTSCPS